MKSFILSAYRLVFSFCFLVLSTVVVNGQVTYRYLKAGGPNYNWTVQPTACDEGAFSCYGWNQSVNTSYNFKDHGYSFISNANENQITWNLPGDPIPACPTGGSSSVWPGFPHNMTPVGTSFAPGSAGNVQNVYMYKKPLYRSTRYVTQKFSYSCPIMIETVQILTVADLTFSPPATICKSGASITLNDYVNHAAGFGTLKVVYSIDGVNLGDGTVAFNPASYAAGDHTLTASMAFHNGTSTINRTITVIDAPSINAQPLALNLCNGGSGGFGVGATANPGSTSLSYNWEISTNGGVGWTQLTEGSGPYGVHTGTTSPTLNLSGVATSKNGNLYRTKVTSQGSCAVTTSNGALLTVYGQVPINTHPANKVICPGDNPVFTIGATAQSGSLAYQWQVSTNGGSTWSNLSNGGVYSGVTSSSLTVSNPPPSQNNYQYRSVVQDGCGSINQSISNAANLTIQVTTAITTQPVNKTGCTGSNVNFSVAALGTTLSYQWQESNNGGSSWADLANIGIYSGVTTNTLTLTNISTAVSGYLYRVRVSGACGVVTSTAATLVATGAPSITTDPVGGIICQNAPYSFTSASTGSGLSYQWEFSTTGAGGSYTNISGATSSSYNLASASLGNAGYYRVKVTNTCGTVTSGFAILTVNPNTAITTQPTNKSSCPNGSVTFNVTANGTGTISYQWQVSTNGGSTYTDLTNTGIFSGVFTNSLTMNGVTPSYDNYKFRVRVTSSCGGSVNSSAATLTMNTIPAAPVAAGVARCGPGSISATATSPASSPTFKWYQNDSDIVSIFTGATYTITNLIATTKYYVSVTSNGCESTKTEVTYTLNPLTPVDIGADMTLCLAQGPYDLNVDIADPAAVGNDFTWSVSGTNYSSTTFNPSVGTGSYVVSYSPPGATTGTPKCYTPNSRTITVITNTGDGGIVFDPEVVSTGNNLNLCVGDDPIILNSIPSAPGGYWSTVSGNGLSFNGTTAIFTPNASSFTDVNPNVLRYTVSQGGCTATKDLNVFVKDNPNKPIVTGIPAVVCPGTTVSLTASVSAPGTFTYEWKKPGASVPLGTSATYNHNIVGTEVIETRSVNSFGCRSEAKLVDIVTPFASGSINASKAVVNVTDAVKFTYDVSAQGNSYEWDFGDGYKSSEQNPTHYYFAPGTYDVTLTITSSLGCSQAVTYSAINVQGKAVEIITGVKADPTTVEDVVINSYPNPVGSELMIESSHDVSEYTVVNMGGIQFENQVLDRPSKSFKVDVSAIPQGIYVISLRLVNGVRNVRIIKI
ncbi:MAG: PKD domain-containing protein [Cyclobacteriaceae bacterium]